jgi:U3 small nucleolar RNA-associated protein 20
MQVCKGTTETKEAAYASPIIQRNALKAVCACIDAFHFAAPGGRLNAAAVIQPAGDAIRARLAQEEAGLGALVPAVDTAAVPSAAQGSDPDVPSCAAEGGEAPERKQAHAGGDAAVQNALVTRVLPMVLRMLTKDKNTVRPGVALAAVKLMRVLPTETEHWQLPKVLQTVANLLSSRMQSVRDDARSVLVKIVAELGPGYMQYVCDVLTLALPARGFTAHVLGYTLHACLQVLILF